MRSYDGIKFVQLKAHLFIQDKNQSIAVRSAHQRCDKLSVLTISNSHIEIK